MQDTALRVTSPYFNRLLQANRLNRFLCKAQSWDQEDQSNTEYSANHHVDKALSDMLEIRTETANHNYNKAKNLDIDGFLFSHPSLIESHFSPIVSIDNCLTV